ncbi:unnamed protein product [Clonostachys solani]|uniref:Uncharacterized protein n=1 Tax=Clonostachys solani TaxID=160281 RepID=A0A9P0EF97_9HYPO|nr:unnamed protein product [Clonostachys solani]
MQLLQSLAVAFWLFGFVRCAFRDDLKAAIGITELDIANTNDDPPFRFWHKAIPAPKSQMELTDLYTEASKAFNWLRTQPHALTVQKSALVAAFYDHRTKKVYMSTILRGKLFNDYLDKELGKSIAPLWYQLRGTARKADAENGAYYYREEMGPPVLDRTYGNTKTGMPEGSKIVVWGVHNGDRNTLPKESGRPLTVCEKCRILSYKLGVEFEDAEMKRYQPPPPPPDTKKPVSAPLNKAEERPATPPPKAAGDKAPSSGGSYGGSAVDKEWNQQEENKLQQLEKSKAKERPATPPPKAAGDKAPSSGSSYGGSAVDKEWNQQEEDKLQRLEKSKGDKPSNKRPASQSPPDSGKHKPQGPTSPSKTPSKTPVALVHRPADGLVAALPDLFAALQNDSVVALQNDSVVALQDD